MSNNSRKRKIIFSDFHISELPLPLEFLVRIALNRRKVLKAAPVSSAFVPTNAYHSLVALFVCVARIIHWLHGNRCVVRRKWDGIKCYRRTNYKWRMLYNERANWIESAVVRSIERNVLYLQFSRCEMSCFELKFSVKLDYLVQNYQKIRLYELRFI